MRNYDHITGTSVWRRFAHQRQMEFLEIEALLCGAAAEHYAGMSPAARAAARATDQVESMLAMVCGVRYGLEHGVSCRPLAKGPTAGTACQGDGSTPSSPTC